MRGNSTTIDIVSIKVSKYKDLKKRKHLNEFRLLLNELSLEGIITVIHRSQILIIFLLLNFFIFHFLSMDGHCPMEGQDPRTPACAGYYGYEQ